MSTVVRINCSKCGAECIEQELACWQCGAPLHASPEVDQEHPTEETPRESPAPKPASRLLGGLLKGRAPAPPPAGPAKPLIEFDPGASADQRATDADASTAEMEQAAPSEPVLSSLAPSSSPRARVTLTGETVEEENQPLTSIASVPEAKTAESHIVPESGEVMIRLTFCKNCGHQNDEGTIECTKCGKELGVIPISQQRDIEMPPRAWGFDVLGAVWIVLGFAAIYCGQFLVKANTRSTHATWSDYFWTGIVVSAPGVLIFMRHHFCKLLFWVMTLGSALVWAVIGFWWLVIGMQISDNGSIGLEWLAALSILSVGSYITVRQNDVFDYGL